MTGRPSTPRLLLAAVMLIALASGVVRWQSAHLDVMFDTDETDYVRGLSYGALANYLGTRERSGFAFARDVLDEYRRTGWARPFKRDWDAGDAAGLRHYHPPVALYPVGMMASAGLRDEQSMRTVPLVTGMLACVASVWLAWLLLAGAPSWIRIGFSAVAGLVTGASPYHVLASTTIGPHAAFSLFSTLVLAALTRAVQQSDSRWWLVACALLGMAVLTVPYWTLLVPAVLWSWWGLGGEQRSLALLVRGGLAALLVTVLAWPPFLLSAGFVKPVLMYASIALSPPDVGRAMGDWVFQLFRTHVVISALLLAGIAAVPGGRWTQLRAAFPTVLFVGGFLVLNLRVSYMKELYAADMIPALAALSAVLAGWAVARLPARFTRPAVGAAVAAAALAIVLRPAGPAAGDWREPLSSLRERFAGQRVLVTPRQAGSMMTYYLDGTRVVLDSDHPDDVAGLRRDLSSGGIDFVIRWGSVVDPNGAAVSVIAADPPDGRVLVDGTTVSWWRIGP